LASGKGLTNCYLDQDDFVFKITVTISGPAQQTQVEITTLLLEKPLRQPEKAADPEAEMWRIAKDSVHPEDVKAFLDAYPNG
jgi:hypothetical protein